MSDYRGEKLHDDDPDFRRGDEGPDAQIGGFAVYGGTPADRRALQEGDPDLTDELRRELGDTLGSYGAETDRPMGRTPLDDMRDELGDGQ